MNSSSNRLMGRCITAAMFLSISLGADRASATLIAHDSFDYGHVQWWQSTTILGEGLQDLAGGTGWNGAWFSQGALGAGVAVWPDDFPAGSRTTALSYTDGMGNSLQTSGGQVRSAYGNASIERRLLAQPIGDLGSTVWVSFLAQSDGISTASPRYAFVELNNTTANNRLWLGKVTPVVTGNWGIQLPENAGVEGGVVSADFGNDYKMNLETMFLMKLDFPDTAEGVTSMSIWLNPADLTDESALSSPVFQTNMKYSTFNQVTIQGRYSTDFDEIRLGTTFDSVTPSIVPEPASGLLFGLGLLGYAMLRRRTE
jgi:hypothetical protein